jgi:flavin reductase (DIM6/NTAB) family NADH-FMN oxidoreductase RutF
MISLKNTHFPMNDTPSESIFHLTNHEIYVITAADQEHISGQVATWVMLTTLVPDRMRVIASISPQNFTCGLIQASQRFVVNLLSQEQAPWLPRFGLHSSRTHHKFEGLAIEFTTNGIPILPGTCGWVECHVGQQVDTGDRIIYIADVVAQAFYPGRSPLRKQDAFAALPPEQLAALTQKRHQDANRDRDLMKPLTNQF